MDIRIGRLEPLDRGKFLVPVRAVLCAECKRKTGHSQAVEEFLGLRPPLNGIFAPDCHCPKKNSTKLQKLIHNPQILRLQGERPSPCECGTMLAGQVAHRTTGNSSTLWTLATAANSSIRVSRIILNGNIPRREPMRHAATCCRLSIASVRQSRGMRMRACLTSKIAEQCDDCTLRSHLSAGPWPILYLIDPGGRDRRGSPSGSW